MCVSGIEICRGVTGYVLFSNFVLAVPIMGHMSKSGTFPNCKMVLVLRLFHLCIRKKILVFYKYLRCSQNGTDVLK